MEWTQPREYEKAKSGSDQHALLLASNLVRAICPLKRTLVELASAPRVQTKGPMPALRIVAAMTATILLRRDVALGKLGVLGIRGTSRLDVATRRRRW